MNYNMNGTRIESNGEVSQSDLSTDDDDSKCVFDEESTWTKHNVRTNQETCVYKQILPFTVVYSCTYYIYLDYISSFK